MRKSRDSPLCASPGSTASPLVSAARTSANVEAHEPRSVISLTLAVRTPGRALATASNSVVTPSR